MSNPANRLHNLLTAVRGKHSTTRTSVAWNGVFGLPDDDISGFWLNMGKVMQLPAVIKKLVQERADLDEGHLLMWGGQVDAAFRNLNPHNQITDFNSQINETSMYSLKTCGLILEKTENEKEIPDKELKDLQDQVFALKQVIQATSIVPEVKDYLLRLLAKATEALQEYRIYGADRLRSVIKETLGSIALDPEMHDQVKKEPLGQKVMIILAAIALMTQITSDVLTIADNVAGQGTQPAIRHEINVTPPQAALPPA